jgi:small neutral amino acid transporter SnatA (MarC family)
MNSIIGYILAAAGLGVLLTAKSIYSTLSNVFEVKMPMIIIAGVGLILIGIFMLMNPSQRQQKVVHAKEEVPIYEGEGKNRRIVGYRKN